MAAESQGCRTLVYRRRRPEQTALYQVVQQHLETYLALAQGDDWDGQRVPAYVEREFRRSLISKIGSCGILAYGFARARCPDCGYDFLVAFSMLAGAGCARRATPGVWRRRRRTWSITSSRRCRCGRWGEERPIVQWTIAALRTAGQDVRTGLPHQGRFPPQNSIGSANPWSASRGRSAPYCISCCASSRRSSAGAAMPAHRPASKR